MAEYYLEAEENSQRDPGDPPNQTTRIYIGDGVEYTGEQALSEAENVWYNELREYYSGGHFISVLHICHHDEGLPCETELIEEQ